LLRLQRRRCGQRVDEGTGEDRGDGIRRGAHARMQAGGERGGGRGGGELVEGGVEDCVVLETK
jgi:hypothetical protein